MTDRSKICTLDLAEDKYEFVRLNIYVANRGNFIVCLI